LNIETSVYASSLTTIKLGGRIAYFVKAFSDSDIVEAINFANKKDLPYKVIGGGSNIIFPDEGYKGVVIKNCISDFNINKNGDEITITAGAGIELDKVVLWSIVNELSGMERLSWIPGTIGAAPVQNVSAYGQSISDVLLYLESIDIERNQVVRLSQEDCEFGYRDSIFKSNKKGNFIITRVILSFKIGVKHELDNVQISEVIEERFKEQKNSLMAIRHALFEIRASKGMVLDAVSNAFGTVGSFFINPEVDIEKINVLKEAYPDIVFFNTGEKYRIPAAWLIEKAGFERGLKFKNVGISPFHNLALITYSGSTTAQLLEFCKEIQLRVKEKFDIDLIPEPDIV